MVDVRPNIALQRTRSAPLREPLSFGTLGGCESSSAPALGQPAARVRRGVIIDAGGSRLKSARVVKERLRVSERFKFGSALPICEPPNIALQRTWQLTR
jgi:hypothetical protein